MTANQINFAALQETKRSNLAKEELTRTSNTINQAHYLRADEAASKQADSAYLNALTNQRNADINAYNATIAKQNADTNMYAAQVRRYEAEQQARQAAVAEGLAPSQIALNQAKANESLIGSWTAHPVASAVKWTADNAGKIVSAAKTFVAENPVAANMVVRVATATTPSVLVNSAVKSIVDLSKQAVPAGIVPLSTTQGGRRHE